MIKPGISSYHPTCIMTRIILSSRHLLHLNLRIFVKFLNLLIQSLPNICLLWLKSVFCLRAYNWIFSYWKTCKTKKFRSNLMTFRNATQLIPYRSTGLKLRKLFILNQNILIPRCRMYINWSLIPGKCFLNYIHILKRNKTVFDRMFLMILAYLFVVVRLVAKQGCLIWFQFF